MQLTQVHDAVQLLRMEYYEMPDLKLTPWQAGRLFNLSGELCEKALRTLTVSGFLQKMRDGSYIRDTGGELPSEAIELMIRATKTP